MDATENRTGAVAGDGSRAGAVGPQGRVPSFADVFDGPSVELPAMLDARERRAAARGVAPHRRVPHAGAGRLEARLAVCEPGESVR